MRQVGDAQQRIAQLNIQRRRLCRKGVRRCLAVGHLPAQRLKRSLIALRLGGPCVFRQAVDFGLRLLRLPDGVPPRLIQRQNLRRQPGQAPARQGGVEGSGIVADGADVMHGLGPVGYLSPHMPDCACGWKGRASRLVVADRACFTPPPFPVSEQPFAPAHPPDFAAARPIEPLRSIPDIHPTGLSFWIFCLR